MLMSTYARIQLKAIKIPKTFWSHTEFSFTIQSRAMMEQVFIGPATVLVTGLAPLMIKK